MKGHVSATIQCPGKEPITATVRDLSRGGIGLILPNALPQNQQFIVQIQCDKGPPKMFCRVANCIQQDEWHFRVGAEFVQVERKTSNNPAEPIESIEAIIGNLNDSDAKTVREVQDRLAKALTEWQ